MADIGGTIRTLVLAESAISSLVGSRMYADVLPQQAAVPAITFFAVDTVSYEHLTDAVGIERVRMQVDCFAATRELANQLSRLVQTRLQKYRGTVSGQFIDDINVAAGGSHRFDRSSSGTDQRRYITSVDYFIHYHVS